MNKILRHSLVLFTFLLAGSAYAEEVTFSWGNVTATQSNLEKANVYTTDPITLTFDKGEGSYYPSENKAGQIRSYNGSVITVQAAEGYVITRLVFTTSEEKYDATHLAFGDQAITNDWTVPTPAQQVVLKGTGTVRTTQLVVTYRVVGAVIVPTPSISGNAIFEGSTKVSIDAPEGTQVYYTLDGTEPTKASQAYTAAFELNQSATVKAVAMKDGQYSEVAQKAFTAAAEAANIGAFKALADKTPAVLTLNNARVVYADSRNAYVKDETGAVCFYGTKLGLKTGDVLNGTVTGTMAVYNNLPELTTNALTNGDKLTVVGGEAPAPTAVSIAEALSDKYLCDLISISNVKLDSVGKNLYASTGADKIQVYDQFRVIGKTPTGTPAENQTITGILVIYKTTYEIYPVTLEGITASIAKPVTTGDLLDAPAYNLAGQRVDAHYKGVVIVNGKKIIRK